MSMYPSATCAKCGEILTYKSFEKNGKPHCLKCFEYNEEDHPRAEDGKWTDSGGGAGNNKWAGGSPDGYDLFMANAKVNDLDVKEKTFNLNGKDVKRSFVVLNKPMVFYHATTKGKYDDVMKNGINKSLGNGKQVDGVYLTGGGESLSKWHGQETRVVKVRVPKDVSVFQDVQPNAVFVEEKVPKEWLVDA